MCPLIQFEVLPRLCNPRALCFMKSDLTSDGAFEQWAVNNILPRPYHPSRKLCILQMIYKKKHNQSLHKDLDQLHVSGPSCSLFLKAHMAKWFNRIASAHTVARSSAKYTKFTTEAILVCQR